MRWGGWLAGLLAAAAGGGTPRASPADGGTGGLTAEPDAGARDGGTALSITLTHTETRFDVTAVAGDGTAFGVDVAADSELWVTSDGRNWSRRGTSSNGGSFWSMTVLPDGTLLADLLEPSGHVLARSTDHGASWTDVLSTGKYRALTPHSFAALDGAVYFLEYQVFTIASTPIRLWKSLDGGATWTVQFTFQAHRHGHGLMPDPARHALFAFFGDFDEQSGLYRSTDGGASWALIKGGTQAGDIVDGMVLPDGSFLCGQDVSFRGSTPDTPQIARIALNGVETDYLQ